MGKKTFFHSLDELITNRGVMKKGGVGVTQEDLGIIENGALLWDSSKGVLWLGPTKEAPRVLIKGARSVNLKGHFLSPALVDCHTHLVFGGSRHEEFALRLSGKSYQEITGAGGGIRASVQATRQASESALLKDAIDRVDAMRNYGVGIVEIKSGYGLDWETERKQLRVVQKIKSKFKNKLLVQATFLGAHDFPPEARTEKDRDAYVQKILDVMLPSVRREKLADACDVFFDKGYYNESQTRRILEAAVFHKMQIKLHADELADTGGAALAAEFSALSADHLLKANEKGIERMAKRGVVATLLPGTAFYLGLEYPDVAMMRRQGVCFALATDYNPGSCPTLNLPFILSLACVEMGMTLPEAFAAATYGGANALGLQSAHGYLRVGMKPKIAVFKCPSYKALVAGFANPGLCKELL